MKKLFLILFASLALAACTKEEAAQSISGSSWYRQQIKGARQITYNLSFQEDHGSLIIYEYVSADYNWRYEYYITSYTFDGIDSGEMVLHGMNLNTYDEDHTISFKLTVNNTKLSASFPHGYSAILDRTK